MKRSQLILPRGSVVKKYELKIIILIAISWTLVDLGLFLLRMASNVLPVKYFEPETNTIEAILLREVNVLLLSLIIGFIMVSILRQFLRTSSLWMNLMVKTLILVLVAMIMNFVIYVSYLMLLRDVPWSEAINRFWENTTRPAWIVPKMTEWVLLFIVTQLAIEINEKYSRGVFFDIMAGKYLQPQEEERIILFVDLRNSTPIAEKLGHKEYFEFIRDFIYCISAGIMEHDGRIYQYVGDEIVAWWPSSRINAKKAISSLLESRKIINKNTEVFKRAYDMLPEYKAGMHSGNVTVGQVGISKKELVMSGDTINTASRIRSACNDLNQKFLVSKDFLDLTGLEDFQVESMGEVDMKGKNNVMELFALKI
jgi:adenylate cyclase